MNPVLFVAKDDGLLNACIWVLCLSSTEEYVRKRRRKAQLAVDSRNAVPLYPFYTLKRLFQVLYIQSAARLP